MNAVVSPKTFHARFWAMILCAGIAAFAPRASAKPYSYIALHDQSTVAVYDHATNTWLGSIAVGTGPIGVGADAAQQNVYVSNFRAGTVTVVRVANRVPIATVSVGASPMGVALPQTQPRAYVANFADNSVTVIDTASNTPLSSINVGEGPTAVTTSTTGDRVFVANTIGNSVSVINPASNLVTQTIPITSIDNPHSKPYALAFVTGPSGSRLLVANNNAASVSIFDGANYALLGELKVGAHPTALAVASSSKVFVLNSFDSSLHTIDPFTATVTAGALPVTARAVSMAVSGSVGSIASAPASLSIVTTASSTVGAPIAIPGGAQAPLTLGNFIINPSFECALDVNGDNAFNDTDATLIARYLTGVRGTALVAGMAGISANSVEPLLAALSLDADNDGTARATTDGVLLHRASKGLIGAPLIANARNANAVGVFNATQILNWIVSTHGSDCLP